MKRVLFHCSGNSARILIAMGWARKLGADKIEAYSSAARPVRAINPYAIEAMAEKGVNLRGQRPKPVEEVPRPIDLIVAVCSGDAEESGVPQHGVNVERWNLPDPADEFSTDTELQQTFRKSRDEIERRVRDLVARI